DRLPGEPRRLHRAPARRRPPLPAGRRVLLRRCGVEQLPVEPALDVPRPARPPLPPGTALPRRLARRARCEPRDPSDPRRRRAREDRGAGDRDRPRHAAQLPRQPSVELRRRNRRRVRAVRLAGAAAIAAALLVPAARADTTPTGPIYDGKGHVIAIPFAPAHDPTQLTKDRATAIFLKAPKVADWVGRYPKKGLITDATFDDASHDWTVNVWWGAAGEIATGKVDDITGVVLTDRDNGPWTGPQVAWEMARGHPSSFGGRDLNSLPIWLGFCALFLLGLADFRRPLCVRNLDLLVLLSFSVSLWYFNHGRIFTSVPLAYPPMLYLLARMAWVGWRGRAPRASRPLWPVWLLAAATVFLAGFRIGLNVEDGNVIDVGYSGAIGAQRIASGEMPYGHMPTENAGQKACAAADTSGRTAYRIQTNGRCEAGDEHGDTYGPVSYEAYLPGYWAYGWKGIGDELNAARFTSVLFDVLCIVGLALVGLRLGGTRLAVTLAFAWAAYPFTQYV